jgi:hypothetical protein
MKYTVKSSDLAVVEYQDDINIIANAVYGNLLNETTGIVPSTFEQGAPANYTLVIAPQNYEQNMQIVVKIAPEVDFVSDELRCHGIAGTDSPNVSCRIVSLRKKIIRIEDAVKYTPGNPGQIKIIFELLRNPNKNVITSSFQIQTKTIDNYPLDRLLTNMSVNFYCSYPCAQCNRNDTNFCTACYPSSAFPVKFKNRCLETCPDGLVNNGNNSCTECTAPCDTCVETATKCTSCKQDYFLFNKELGFCREIVRWPFPYVITGILSFFIVACSEIKTGGVSHFKESFIAFLSIPEFFSWLNFTFFIWYFNKQEGVLLGCVIACGLYMLINFIHFIIHPRKMVPRTLYSYK